jgi:hypothetical protein
MGSVRMGEHRPYVYVLNQRDGFGGSIKALATDSSIIPAQFDYNSYYIGIGSGGALTDRISYGVEAVYEGGDTLSANYTTDSTGTKTAQTQTRDTIDAWAMDGRLDYTVPDEHATRFGVEAIVASGDRDRQNTTNTIGGNRANTKDRAFNAFGLLNVGVAFAPPVSNLIVLRGGVSTFPLPQYSSTKHLRVGTDLYGFGKCNSQAPIDETTTHNTYLGAESDLYINWQFTSDLTWATRYGVFVPGDAIPDRKARQFLYTSLTLAF